MINNILIKLRNSIGLTVREVGKLLSLDYSYITKIEKGNIPISNAMMERLTKFYNVEKNYILDSGPWYIYLFTEDRKRMFYLSSVEIKEFPNCFYSIFDRKKNKVFHILKEECKKDVLKYIDIRNKTEEIEFNDEMIIKSLSKLSYKGKVKAKRILEDILKNG